MIYHNLLPLQKVSDSWLINKRPGVNSTLYRGRRFLGLTPLPLKFIYLSLVLSLKIMSQIFVDQFANKSPGSMRKV